jgi:hypothetical protein
MGTVAVRRSGKPCPRGVAVSKTLGAKAVYTHLHRVRVQALAGLRFGKMPTETKKPSDLAKHHPVGSLQVLTGTPALPKSRILLDIEKLTIGSFLALLMSHAALGDDADGGANNTLNPIIVTATRTPENESQIGSAVSQLTAEQLETEQIYNVKQALNTTPGVFSLETGASGGFTTVSIRGNDPSYSLVLVDGIRVNTGIFDNADPFLAYAQPRRRARPIWLRSLQIGKQQIGGSNTWSLAVITSDTPLLILPFRRRILPGLCISEKHSTW